MTSADEQRDALLRFDQLEDGGLHEIEARLEDNDAESLIVLREGDSVRAWLNVCPHAGRRLDWAPGRFLKDKQGHLVCAVHGATFELQGGECIAGPCRGAALRTIPVVVEDGFVRVVRTCGSKT